MNTKLHTCFKCVGGLGPVPTWFSGWWFSLCEPPWAQVSWLCRSSCDVLDSSSFFNFILNSSIRFCEFCLMFACGPLHQFPSSAGWPQGAVMLGSVCKHSAEYQHCQDLALSHGMNLNLGQSLVGHSFNLCSLFYLMHLVVWKNFELEVVWVGW